VSSTGEQALPVLLVAAAPVTLLTALSKSSLGTQVQAALEEKLPELQEEAERLRAAHAGR
jgi:light-harvesting complex II chlorophyll a/b binding protein 7